jgi:hypothetical protein
MKVLKLLMLVALVLVIPAAAADSFTLTVVSQTSTTITFSYPQQPGYGYLYSANGTVVSRTNDPARTQVRFAKAESYEVAAIVKGTTGSYTQAPPPPPPTGTITQNLFANEEISSTGSWQATYDANGDGQPDDPGSVAFLVDGIQSFVDASVPFGSTSWDSTVYPDGTHAMTVRALDGAGATIVENTVTVNFVNGNGSPPPPPPPPSGGTMTSAQCNSAAGVSGATIQNVTVTGGCSAGGSNVTFSNVTVQGTLGMGNGTHVTGSTLRKFQAFGADNWVIENSVLDGAGLVANNEIWDSGSGHPASGWTIRNNTIKNYYVASNPGTHSEGIYNGYSANGLIEGNTFTNNGNTGHIFFTWFGSTANSSTSYPRNICVRGNTFGPTHGAYVDINFRSEIPTSSGIKIQSNATTTSPQFYGAC